MKIAQIAPLIESVPPRFYGGTERIVSYLTEELARLGHDVTLFASGDSVTSARLVSCATTALRLNRSARPGDTADDGLLRKMGITVMAVGWEFDVPVRNGAIRIDVPVATDNGKPITGIVRATFTPNNRDA